MKREVEECPHRVIRALTPEKEEDANCAVVGRILGPSLEHLSRVNASVCRACCEYTVPSPNRLNPVVASVIFGAAGQVVDDVDASWRQHEDAARSQTWVKEQLQFVRHPSDDRSRPGRVPSESQLQWVVGVITPPCHHSTLNQRLRGLQTAGFSVVHIFAEPGSSIPDQFSHLPRTVHERPLSYRTRIIAALASLFAARPKADAYALFGDNVEPAPDLPRGVTIRSGLTALAWFHSTPMNHAKISRPDGELKIVRLTRASAPRRSYFGAMSLPNS